MITVKNRTLCIPSAENHIGFVGDNKIEVREFEITDKALFDFDFKLDLKSGAYIGIIDLVKTVEADRIILTWTILQEHIFKELLYIQLRAFDNTDLKWHSNTGELYAYDSINATEYFPSPLPNEFEQMEQRVTDIQKDVTYKADTVAQDKIDVATDKQTVLEKAAEALQSALNALESEQNAKTSETNAKGSETNAFESMKTAVQAMTDLLNMMGTDIATLTGGKLTPSQIPAIAITDTFVVDNETAMLSLTAETGDVCIRTDENKSYILQGTNPAILTDWQHLQTPTNYADTAGHALTADEATNATKINGHRVVYMTQEQFEIAVKEPDTIYLVGVE